MLFGSLKNWWLKTYNTTSRRSYVNPTDGNPMQRKHFPEYNVGGVSPHRTEKVPDQNISDDAQAIYCYGPFLHEAQISKVLDDSKTFVDMKAKFDTGEILRKFKILAGEVLNLPSANKVAKLAEFIAENLSPVSNIEDLTKWTPNDWVKCPRFLENVEDDDLRFWGAKLNMLWKNLGRKIAGDVVKNTNNHTLIYCSHPFIIPGGRFREFYYWDNYWINRGLLLCEMHGTVRGMIRNFFEMVATYGFVPNGGRIYYTRRSQPPFLSLMVRDYVDCSGDLDFIEEALPFLEKEYLFWEEQRTVNIEDCNGHIHCLSRYASDTNQPRPEAYREDYELINQHGLENDAKHELMSNIASACESGWDFSSRWTGTLYDGARGHELLLSTNTRDIIPVDLNSILSVVERILADFNRRVGNIERADTFLLKHERRLQAMEIFLWNELDGSYYDYVISKGISNRQYFISNFTPLWTKSYAAGVDVVERERSMYQNLKSRMHGETELLDLKGGIPVSLNDSGQQWDFPNVWPPCSHMIIEGLSTSESIELREEGFIQAQKYVKTCWNGFTNPKYKDAMFEKYNVLTDDGLPGKGGEYKVQEGFGWTNGVAICLLHTFGDRLTSRCVTNRMRLLYK